LARISQGDMTAVSQLASPLPKIPDSESGAGAPAIAKLQAAGATTLRAIPAGLNERKVPTARGAGEWSAVQVLRWWGGRHGLD
jgi:hypothetical protein